jgi:hypothetical protein
MSLGRKVFTAGEVLAAADVNGIMDQTVMVFANSAGRTSQIPVPTEGMVTYLQDTNALEFYNGAAFAPVSNPGDITAVTAGTALSGGGTSGDVTLNVNLGAITIPISQVTSLQTSLDGKVDEVNGAVTTAATGSTVVRNITLSTADPTGGSDGQVWLKYTA